MQRGAQPVGSHKHRSFAHCDKCQLFAPTTHAPHKDFLNLYEKVSGKGGKCW